MLLKEKILGSVQCETVLCRSKLDQVILLLISFSLIFYAWFEQQTSASPLMTEFRLWVGIVFLIIVGISFLDVQLKSLMLGTMNKIPFLVIPAMLTNLYYKNVEPYYTMYFLTMYASMSFLIPTKKGMQAYILIMTTGIAAVIFNVQDSEMHEYTVLFSFITISILIWVIGSEFLWNYKRLANELNRVTQLSYLNSHKLRAHVARIIGLNNLIDIGDDRARGLLKNEIKAVEVELHNIQNVINTPLNSIKRHDKTANDSLSPFEYTLIAAELVFLINVYFIR